MNVAGGVLSFLTRPAPSLVALSQAAQQPVCQVAEAQLGALWRQGGGGAGLPHDPYLPAAQAALQQHSRWLRTHAQPLCQWLEDLK